MPTKALFSGTFDPFHAAHAWQLKRAYDIQPFDQVLVAVIESNPKKPNAAAWQHRLALAQLTLQALDLPFEWEVTSVPDVTAASLEALKEQRFPDTAKPLRVLGSDSVIEFVHDENLRPALSDFDHLITVRPETPLDELDQAIHDASSVYGIDFVHRIVPIPADQTHIPDVSARNLRHDIAGSANAQLIVPVAADYMQAHGLYSYGTRQS